MGLGRRRRVVGDVTVGEAKQRNKLIENFTNRHSRESLPSTPIGGGNPGVEGPTAYVPARLDSRFRGNDDSQGVLRIGLHEPFTTLGAKYVTAAVNGPFVGPAACVLVPMHGSHHARYFSNSSKATSLIRVATLQETPPATWMPTAIRCSPIALSPAAAHSATGIAVTPRA